MTKKHSLDKILVSAWVVRHMSREHRTCLRWNNIKLLCFDIENFKSKLGPKLFRTWRYDYLIMTFTN